MKSKIISIIFVSLCVCICAVPSVCMTFAPTNSTTENKRLKQLPSLTENDGVNLDYLSELGEWFGDHYAFRNAMVDADSHIQGDVFSVSNADTVVKGNNGWLYYSDTLNDYLGKKTLSDRAVFNIAHNLAVIQDYVEARKAKFVFTVAPNKNSLYDENMPYYYSRKASEKRNINSLLPELKKEKINYTDLFGVFKDSGETLYLKRDSHWNNKGAMLAFSEIMKGLDRDFTDYSKQKVKRLKTEIGDLGSMLYPNSAQPEWNYYYDNDGFEYSTPTKSVEDAYIETSSDGSGKLLMYRDSFGNTLLPFFACDFKKACFSKAAPYTLEENMNSLLPDCVVIEKVERNLDDLASDPPLISAPEIKEKTEFSREKTNSTLNVSESATDRSYYLISGVADSRYVTTSAEFYVRLKTDVGDRYFKTFNISDENGDNGYSLYLRSGMLKSGDEIELIAVNGSKAAAIASASV